MIHRQNYHDIRAYLKHIERVRQNDILTVKRARGHLRHLLEWADASPLPKARAVDPTFPAYLMTARADGKQKTLAPASVGKCLANARQFFTFARAEWPLRYKSISESWIEFLQPPRHLRAESRLPVRQFYTLDQVLQIARVSTETLRQERGKVAVCMLFLSGMRSDALASLPIACVDLAANAIHQLPEAGVRTKNHKAAITYLLQVPELLDVIHAWDQRVRRLPVSALWYATLTSDGMALTGVDRAFEGRNNAIERDVRLICQRAGVPYLSPHKLRHGHVVYAIKLAQTMAQMKAISQNVMHSSLVITDKVYGNLMGDDVGEIITHLGHQTSGDILQQRLQELLEILQSHHS